MKFSFHNYGLAETAGMDHLAMQNIPDSANDLHEGIMSEYRDKFCGMNDKTNICRYIKQ